MSTEALNNTYSLGAHMYINYKINSLLWLHVGMHIIYVSDERYIPE